MVARQAAERRRVGPAYLTVVVGVDEEVCGLRVLEFIYSTEDLSLEPIQAAGPKTSKLRVFSANLPENRQCDSITMRSSHPSGAVRFMG